ncbi:MAG TPA: isoaspartyl peptidase/L-asparaginase family protein [Gemmatimonadales bacterium]|nr:isoaspartyl peptidase/L-asparaginase family protein [Gemmatimonadales bacterium]
MWALILHGGAKAIDAAEVEASRAGCLRALDIGRHILSDGGSAIDAVEAVVRALEDNPTFNAGTGSVLNAEGEVEMCSAIMEGSDFNAGGVAIIRGVTHPISVARALLFEKPILLAGEGARKFAADNGCELCDPASLLVRHHETSGVGHDTVGCVARDEAGRMAVGTSTGGLEGCAPGRVGDAPLPGCGYYVDDKVGGVALSGDGEQIARKMLAARVMHMMDSGSPDDALHAALQQVAALDGEAGIIVLTADGVFAWQHNSADFAVAYQSSRMEGPAVHTNKHGGA